MANKPRRVEPSTSRSNNFEPNSRTIESESLKPISKVVRELTSPDGTTLRVEVPVYPPFRLKEKSVEGKDCAS
jgi:hypothetical protein